VTAQGVELVAGASLEAPQQSSQLETLATISSVVTMTFIQPVRQASCLDSIGSCDGRI